LVFINNYNDQMKIYFAGSIRGGRDDKELYLEIIRLLQQYGEVLTEHIGNNVLSAQGEAQHSDEFIFARDINFLEECDMVVAEVTTPSLGVGYEIGRIESRKPILCLFREQQDKKLSAMLAGNESLEIKKYRNPTDIEEILKNFMNQQKTK